MIGPFDVERMMKPMPRWEKALNWLLDLFERRPRAITLRQVGPITIWVPSVVHTFIVNGTPLQPGTHVFSPKKCPVCHGDGVVEADYGTVVCWHCCTGGEFWKNLLGDPYK